MKLFRTIQALLKDATNPSRDSITKTFSHWVEHRVIDHDEYDLLMSVTSFSQLQVRDVMVPRQHMVAINENDPLQDLMESVVKNHHSRYPVWDKKNEKIVGIVLAKDILSHMKAPEPPISSIMRPPSFVPESQRLDTLLRNFKSTHNHMAIVVDEFGGVSGVITIEDVLEQIVGEIEDEHDVAPSEPFQIVDEAILVQGTVTIAEFNDYFSCSLDDQYFDTIAGFIAQKFGYIPQVGESISMDGYSFKITQADKRKITLLEVREY